MQQVAKRAHADNPEGDFEALIVAFGGQSDILGDLENYARLTETDDPILAAKIIATRKFVQEIRQRGIGHTLEVIVNNSRPANGNFSIVSGFIKLTTGAFSGRVTIANLNYDDLILTELSDHYSYNNDFSDLGAGYDKRQVNDVLDKPFFAFPLRSTDNLINRIRLLDLHGAVTFWRFGNRYEKINLDTARESQLWERYRLGQIDAEPLVVLANKHDKADHVKREPFRLAYDIADTDFRNAEHWLIAGYSFRDKCVNDLLKRAMSVREERQEPTKILIVTNGDGLTSTDVENAFGWESGKFSDHNAKIERTGIDGLRETAAWKWFVGEEPPF